VAAQEQLRHGRPSAAFPAARPGRGTVHGYALHELAGPVHVPLDQAGRDGEIREVRHMDILDRLNISKEEGMMDIKPDGISLAFNGTDTSCSISHLIEILEAVKQRFGDVRIGVYETPGQIVLMPDIEEGDIEQVIIRMSLYN